MTGNAILNEMLKVFSKYHQAHHELVNKWRELILFTPRWWLGLILGILPWVLWWKFHNKKYTGDLLRAGFLMAIISLILDSIGVQIGFWIYPYDVFPFIPGYIPWDLTLLPLSIMFLIEIKPQWSPLLKALIYALLVSLIGEPLAIFINIYEPIYWNNLYSFPIYILLFLLTNKFAKCKVFNSSFN